MKINAITNYSKNNSVYFKQKETERIAKQKKTGMIMASSVVLGTLTIGGIVAVKKCMPNKYIKNLAKDLSLELQKEIKPSDLKSVMTKEEFAKVVKTLKEENYVSSDENIKNGIFRADFHSHSEYSDGSLTVSDIMNQAADYGNRLNQTTGKKFLFAISDHDGIEGVKEALKIIAENPDKFKNVKFIPAAELSMPISCESSSIKFNQFHNDVETVELLIYGINPFSANSEKYFSSLYCKRAQGIDDALTLASTQINDVKFLKDEYNKYYSDNKMPYCMLNQHWRIYHYINLKTRISRLAKEQNQTPEKYFEDIMDILKKRKKLTGEGLNEYLKEQNLEIKTPTYLKEVQNLVYDICPSYKGPVLWAPYESSFSNIVQYAKNEDAVLCLAHPVFTIQNMNADTALFNIQNYIKHSDGRLLYSENFHQAYPPKEVSSEEIKETNELMEKTGLIPIGGRDKHNDNFKF